MKTKSEILREAFLVPCNSKEALGRWLRIYLGVDLYATRVSRFATSSPLDAAWDLYSAALFPETRSPSRFMFVAARSTQKTLTLAAIELAIMLHDRRNVIHYAAAETQLVPFKGYLDSFTNQKYVQLVLEEKPTSDFTKLVVPNTDSKLWSQGDNGKEVSLKDQDQIRRAFIELLPITPFTSQGRHQPGVFIDEIHTLSGNKLSAYKDIHKIPVASPEGKPWIRAAISSRKGPYTVVEQELESATVTGLQIRQWTVFEGVEQCPDEKSGKDFIHKRFVNIYDGQFYTEDEYKTLETKVQAKCQETTLATGCLSCPLARFCLGDLKKEKPPNKRYQTIEAAITDVLSYTDDPALYLSQCLSLQPSKEGLVFSRYDSDVHDLSENEMYEKFMGEKPVVQQTLESLVALFHRKGLKAHAGVDHGFSDPFSIVIGFTDGERMFIVYNYAQSGLEPEKHIKPLLHDLYAKFGPFPIYPDTSRPEINSMLRGAGFDIQDDFVKKIDDGISLIRGALAPLAGPPRLYFLKDFTAHIRGELIKYHYDNDSAGNITDVIVDDFNHSLDAARYLYLNVFSSAAKFSFSFGSEQEDSRESMRRQMGLVTALSPQPQAIPQVPGTPNYVSSSFNWNFDTDYGDSDD